MNLKVSRSKVFVIVALIVLVAESAVPQLQTQKTEPKPEPIMQQGDRATIGMPQANSNPNIFPEVLGAGVGGAVLVTAFLKLFEKYGTNYIEGQKSRLNLEIESRKLELELKREERMAERKEVEGKDEIIKTTLNTALSNLTQGARESREVYYILVEKLETGNQLNQKEFSIISEQLATSNRHLESMDSTIKQILNVLKMRDRGSNPE